MPQDRTQQCKSGRLQSRAWHMSAIDADVFIWLAQITASSNLFRQTAGTMQSSTGNCDRTLSPEAFSGTERTRNRQRVLEISTEGLDSGSYLMKSIS
jgi:hypothetical protein